MLRINLKIKVAIIGCGSIAEFRHAPEYFDNPEVKIVAFCDPSPGRAGRLADRYGGQAFTHYEDTLTLGGMNVVSICISNNTHVDIAIKNSGLINGFIEAILYDRKPPITGIDGYKALSIVLPCSHR